MKLDAIIIEDERKLREVFIQLLRDNCPGIEIIGDVGNITEGYELIIAKRPAIVFLDIEMPGGNGFELLSRFEKIPFETVFVSSYGHYAIRAIKLSALDYLLKPVLIDDLLKMTERIRGAIDLKESAFKYSMLKTNLKTSEHDKKLFVQTKHKIEQISLSEIIYLQAESNYTSIFIAPEKRLVVSKTLKEYEEVLCESENSFFVRIHKTFIVNTHFVKTIARGDESFLLLKDNTRLEVSRRRKSILIDRCNLL